MDSHDDDLTSWRDDPIVRALTGPGTAEELGGEADALAGFRAAVPVRSRRRLVGRLGITGGSALGVAVLFSTGVAAAYTGSLPRPVQHFFYDVLKPIGVPEAPKDKAAVNHANPRLTIPTVSPTPTAVPVAPRPTVAVAHPRPAASPHHKPHPSKKPKPSPSTTASPTPTATPVPVTTPTPTPTPTPSPTETSPSPSDSITISLSDTTVAPGATVTVYGQLATSTGDPISGQDVWLLQRTPGQAGVSQVASGTTGNDGSVTLTSPPLAHSARLRLVTGTKVKSAPIAVIVAPTLAVSVATQGTSSQVTVATTGGDPGDTIDIEILRDHSWQAFAASQLDSAGNASFGVTTPTSRPDRYRALLPRTPAHGAAVTRFTVSPG